MRPCTITDKGALDCQLMLFANVHRFGLECGVDFKYVQNFGEEVVRGQPVFALSPLLSFLMPMLRNTAGVGSWQVPNQL